MLEVGLIVYALHMGVTQEVNNVTPGIVVSHVESGLSTGALRNSHGNLSVFVQKEWKLNERIKVGTGAISGYSLAPVLPLLSLNISVSDNLKLSYLPPFSKGSTKYGTLVTTWTF